MMHGPASYFQYLWQLLTGERAGLERWVADQRQSDLAPYLDFSTCLRILDLANGQLRPQYTLLRAAGHRVVGIDLVNQRRSTWEDLAYRVGRYLYTRGTGLPTWVSGAEGLVLGDVRRLPFPDGWFDLVTSVAAFEHFVDVPNVVEELSRVIRPDGLVWVWIHLFTSLSGGHNLSKTEVPLRRIPSGIDPWDHLRRRRLPMTVPLNQWRRDRYLDAFASRFRVLRHYCAITEGEDLLTPELEEELATYGRGELTCGAYVIVAQKVPHLLDGVSPVLSTQGPPGRQANRGSADSGMLKPATDTVEQ